MNNEKVDSEEVDREISELSDAEITAEFCRHLDGYARCYVKNNIPYGVLNLYKSGRHHQLNHYHISNRWGLTINDMESCLNRRGLKDDYLAILKCFDNPTPRQKVEAGIITFKLCTPKKS
jgi:hypothetical protein